jgi:hypothetical protein
MVMYRDLQYLAFHRRECCNGFSILLVIENKRAERRVVAVFTVRLFKGVPHHGFTLSSNACHRWPAPNFTALAAQNVDTVHTGEVTILFKFAKKIPIESALLKPLRD